MANPGMYRADHIGSLLLPKELEQLRSNAPQAEKAQRQEMEDAAIKRAVALQREIGLSIVSDGEFRRDSRASLLADAVSARMLIHEEVSFLQSLLAPSTGASRVPFKITLPAPSALSTQMAGRLRSEVQALIAVGVNYIQIQNTGYSQRLTQSGSTTELDDMISADIAALDGLMRPADVCVALHVGRGAATRVGLFDEANAPFAERLFSTMPVDRFVLEVDDDPTGGFSVLRHVPNGRSVALGLISARTKKLEDRDAILDRLDEAAGHIDGDRLAVCPQGGFADSGLSEDDQRRKLELIVSISTRYWGFEA